MPEKLPDAPTTLDELRAQHERADERLRELDRRAWLSPAEQLEQSRLKKQKLRLKDAMRALAAAG